MSLEKKPSTALSQEQEVGVKWNVHLGCLASSGQHLRMFMGGIVVEDGVDHLAGRDGPLESCDEADELLMRMARHAAADEVLARPLVKRGLSSSKATP